MNNANQISNFVCCSPLQAHYTEKHLTMISVLAMKPLRKCIGDVFYNRRCERQKATLL